MAYIFDGPAVFSTKRGRLQHKQPRPYFQVIVRSDRDDDMRDMAIKLCQEFPEYCVSMTMEEVQHLGKYFDPYDIQIQTPAFLTHVLEYIVSLSFAAAVVKSQAFAARWKEEYPRSYERLAFNAKVDEVFSEEHRNAIQKRDLESILNILIRGKFPEGMTHIARREFGGTMSLTDV